MTNKQKQGCPGYFRVFRCILEHPAYSSVWENGLRFRLLMWIFCRAEWRDKTIRTPLGQAVRKGELVTSVGSLVEKMREQKGPGGKWHTPHESSIRRALKFFVKADLITIQADNRGTHIHILDYGECPVHVKESSESVPETADQSIPQPELKREEIDGGNSLNDNDIESCNASNRRANEGGMEGELETSKEVTRTLTQNKQSSLSKDRSSESQRATARPSRRKQSSSSEQHHRNGKEKFQGGLTIMAMAGGFPEEVKEIVEILRPVAISVLKAQRKSLPKEWHSDNCSEIEEWVAEGKVLEEISDLLDAALEDGWWSPKLVSISMLRKFEDQREERKTNPKTKHKGSNMCPDCGRAKYYCVCSTE